MIIIPAAGEGRRFREAGYEVPKHLIPLGGRSMLERVIENVRPLDPFGLVVIADQEEVGKTAGAVDTILRAAKKHPPHSWEPLVIANCDQLLKWPDWYYNNPFLVDGDGVVFTFPSQEDSHSYVVTDNNDRIWGIREKQVVSNQAVSGVYWFKNPAPFLHACEEVMQNRIGDELYVSKALEHMIRDGYHLTAVDMPTAILGTPEDFQRFEVALACAS